MARARRRISTQYCVHEGRPSWHQQKAGGISAATSCYWSKKEAQRYMRAFKKRHPNEPVFIVPTRKLRHFSGGRR